MSIDGFPQIEGENGTAHDTLAAWIGGQCIPHAILIEGPNESANAAIAIYTAKAAMCTGEDKPCGSCRDCVKIEKNVHPDLLYFSGDGKARSFHIDTVRDIKSKAFIRPNEGPKKVFILKNAQDMTVQAQNALLKVLEEPPESVIFILTCENKSFLLETVLSRVSAIYSGDNANFGDSDSPPRPDSGEVLPDGENSACNQEIENERNTKGAEIIRLLLASEELEALALLSAYERNRAGFIEVLSQMRRELELMIIPASNDNESDNANKNEKNISGNALLRLLRVIDIIDEISRAAVGNGNLALLTTKVATIFAPA